MLFIQDGIILFFPNNVVLKNYFVKPSVNTTHALITDDDGGRTLLAGLLMYEVRHAIESIYTSNSYYFWLVHATIAHVVHVQPLFFGWYILLLFMFTNPQFYCMYPLHLP
ncbi:hypothetical protein ACJX0J_034394 [Zea mays]